MHPSGTLVHFEPPILHLDFLELMQLYESNFGRLTRLAPELDRISRTAYARVPGLPDLFLEVLERCRYTTTIRLSRHSHDRLAGLEIPGVSIRVYHDARLAEAYCVLSSEREDMRGDKGRRNRWLEGWLSDCLVQGYRFGLGERSPSSPVLYLINYCI